MCKVSHVRILIKRDRSSAPLLNHSEATLLRSIYLIASLAKTSRPSTKAWILFWQKFSTAEQQSVSFRRHSITATPTRLSSTKPYIIVGC